MKRTRGRRTSGDFDREEASSSAKTGRTVSDEEATLWAVATQSLEPLKRAKQRVSGKEILPPADGSRKREASPGSVTGRPHEPSKAPGAGQPRAAQHRLPPKAPTSQQPVAPRRPPLADFERRVARKVAIGQAEIDARLDLHGMTQGAAQRRLRSFLRSAHSDGCRIVLVITGKGREADGEPETFAEHMEKRERGVLKRSVPIWLEDPDMRAIVLSFTTASQQHGGSGALYVRLRRRTT